MWRKDHHGMRVCIEGLMDTLTGKRGEITKGDLQLAEQFTKHLKELGRRFYSDDLTVVDEFLQLYDLDQLRASRLALPTLPPQF